MGFLLLGSLCGSAFGQLSLDCGHFETYAQDYRTASQRDKTRVEGTHFTPDVEYLRGGNAGPLGADLSYTLRRFPNHPRALLSMMKYAEREKSEQPPHAQYSVSCYFERAIRFAPDDSTPRVLFGVYLARIGADKAAIAQLESALKLAGDKPDIHYNIGLAYFDLKDYDRALEHAHKAYSLGFPLPGLRNKLERAGKWRD
jgi:Tfp pilus assembly protein PilF